MKSILSLAASQYILLAGQFLTGPLLARALGLEGRGQLSVVLVTYTLLPVIVGLGSTATFRRAAASGSDSIQARNSLIRSSVFAGLLSAPVAVTLAFSTDGLELSERLAYVALILTAALANYRNAVVSGSIALGDTKPASRNALITGIVTTLGIVALFFANSLTLFSALVVYCLATLFAFSGSPLRLTWNRTSNHAPSKFYGIKAIPGQLGELALLRVDQLLAALILGFAAAGEYAVGWSLAYLAYPIFHSLALHRAASERDVLSTKEKVARMATATVLIACIGLSAPVVIPFLFGEEFDGAVIVTQALLPAMIMMGLVTREFQRNLSEGRAGINSGISILALAFTITLSALLGQSLGTLGIALASNIGIGTCLFLLVIMRFMGRANVSSTTKALP